MDEQRAVDALYRRIELLEGKERAPDKAMLERVSECERAMKRLDLEMASWYDKFRALYNRLAKREQRERDEESTPPEVSGQLNRQEAPAGALPFAPNNYEPPAVPVTAELAARFKRW